MYISFVIVLGYTQGVETFPQKYDYSKTDWEIFSSISLSIIDDVYLLPLSSVQEIDVAVKSFRKLISDATADLTPVFGNERSKKYAWWWNLELTRLRQDYSGNLGIKFFLDDSKSEVNMKNSLRYHKH